MSDETGQDEQWRLPLPGAPAIVDLDPRTGLPSRLSMPDRERRLDITVTTSAALLVGGAEQRPLGGGLEYPGATWLRGSEPDGPSPRAVTCGTNAVRRVRTRVGGWPVTWDYQLQLHQPRLRMSMGVGRADGDSRPLRNAEIEFRLRLPGGSGWQLHAPGNRLRPATPLTSFDREFIVATAGGNLGSPGLIALSNHDEQACLVLWPFSRTEIGQVLVAPAEQGLIVRITTDLAGDPPSGTTLEYSGIYLDLIAEPWAQVRPQVRSWFGLTGLGSPGAKPDWAQAAAIYEVQPGRSVFSGGYAYQPYRELRDIAADLPRIADLGFTAVQVMPRQPYPSYNVHDYADVETTYGPPADLAALITASHSLGLRVILDVVLHGVIDRRAVTTALRTIENSGVLEQPPGEACDVFAGSPRSWQALQRAWCQHVVDFAPYWLAGSPRLHPLTKERPGWFCRDSAGHITGIYTEAFDLANEDWQEYFSAAVLDLTRRFEVDGFRFDAPTYNNFANWAPGRRARASASPLGSVTLFERLRPRLQELRPGLMMFTEPSGLLHRESMDMNYNYDELWLIPAVMAPEWDGPPALSGADVALWMDERDATLPADALTAHHSDSHDTFWWPSPGLKWRREQLGVPAARAWMQVMALCGGVFLMFTGGEQEIEDDLRRTLRLRQERAELARGAARFNAVSADRDEVFAVVRELDGAGTLVLVNLSVRQLTTTCTLAPGLAAPRPADYYTPARNVRPAGPGALTVELGPYDLALIDLSRRAR